MGTIKRNFYNNITPTGKFDSADLTGTIPATNVADASLTNITSVPASVGDLVQKVASDPTPASAGDVWYNTTSNALKSVVALEAWSSGSNLIRAFQGMQSAGTQTAALGSGGYNGSSPYRPALTQEYNGSGWSTGGDMPSGRNVGNGFGTQTAAIVAGGYDGTSLLSSTISYNGTSWTAVNSLSGSARYVAAASGTQTAGVISGGYFPPVGNVTEEWDGTCLLYTSDAADE